MRRATPTKEVMHTAGSHVVVGLLLAVSSACSSSGASAAPDGGGGQDAAAAATSDGASSSDARPTGDGPSAGEGGGGAGGEGGSHAPLVLLQWAASTTPGVTYDVERGTAHGGPYTQLQSGVTATSVTDTTATPGTTYYYVVQSQDANGQSPDSHEAQVTP